MGGRAKRQRGKEVDIENKPTGYRQRCCLRLCEHLATLLQQEVNEVIKSMCADGEPSGESYMQMS